MEPENREPEEILSDADFAGSTKGAPVNKFDLLPDQKDTASLLQGLLGKTFADRYVDFCRLAAGAFDLRVSRPVAAHALRELESSLRQVLEVPMEAKTPTQTLDPAKRQATEEKLKEFGFGADAIREAIKALTPRVNHKAQIRQIAARLGLAEDGDVAKSWLSLSDIVGRAHQRSFHHSLIVDDAFRAKYQQPFDTVIRAVAIALRGRYVSLMLRVDELAAMSDRKVGVELFASEIPGALPLQRRFYDALQTGDWLPHLAKNELLGVPLTGFDEEPGRGMRPREWPAGSYLLRMAESPDVTTRKGVIEALREVASSQHPDIQYDGIEIRAALPADESAAIAALAVGWLNREVRVFSLVAPEKLLKKLAVNRHPEAALTVARALLQVWDHNGQIASLYGRFMYEHHLPSIATALTESCGEGALRLLLELLQQADKISDGSSYSHYSSRPIADDERAKTDIYEALLSAVRHSAEILIKADSTHMRSVIGLLTSHTPKIFVRVALHVLSLDPAAAPDLADAYLLDQELIEATWCRAEYTAMALVWFPSLEPAEQASVLRVVDASPEKYRAAWRVRFEDHRKVAPAAEDERRFDAATIRDMLWLWRAVLPAERQAALEGIAKELGEPHAWKNRLFFPVEESPLTGRDFSGRSIPEIVEFLRLWRPTDQLQTQTVTALAQELRTAVSNDPKTYAAMADQFAGLMAVYVRHLLDGLRSEATNVRPFEWGNVLKLVEFTYAQLQQTIDPSMIAEGDDRDWTWACMTASELLIAGLQRGSRGINFEHATHIRSLVSTLVNIAPRQPEPEDFEERYQRELYFGAQATLRGRAVELCALLMFWLSKDASTLIGSKPREALANLPDVRGVLEVELADQSPTGRIPRAILGRYLPYLFYFGQDWLKSHMCLLFPDTDESLRHATWLSYLWHGQGPVSELMPELSRYYVEEIAHLTNSSGHEPDRHFREDSLADHIVILHLWGVLPQDLQEQFGHCADVRMRQHAMWFLGQQLQSPLLPAEMRLRGLSYWERRLAAAIKSPDPDSYREELGAIGQWCLQGQIDDIWLSDQLIAMFNAGFVPTDSSSVVEWLQKISTQHVDRAVLVLARLIMHPRVDEWAYITQRAPIRGVLMQGLADGTAETVNLVGEVVGVLASKGETSYLDLVADDASRGAAGGIGRQL